VFSHNHRQSATTFIIPLGHNPQETSFYLLTLSFPLSEASTVAERQVMASIIKTGCLMEFAGTGAAAFELTIMGVCTMFVRKMFAKHRISYEQLRNWRYLMPMAASTWLFHQG